LAFHLGTLERKKKKEEKKHPMIRFVWKGFFLDFLVLVHFRQKGRKKTS